MYQEMELVAVTQSILMLEQLYAFHAIIPVNNVQLEPQMAAAAVIRPNTGLQMVQTIVNVWINITTLVRINCVYCVITSAKLAKLIQRTA